MSKSLSEQVQELEYQATSSHAPNTLPWRKLVDELRTRVAELELRQHGSAWLRSDTHERWRKLTNDGQADNCVKDAREHWNRLYMTLRARYTSSLKVLQLLDEAEAECLHDIKFNLVSGGRALGYGPGNTLAGQ